MADTGTSAYPVRSLREQVTALEAAVTQCLAAPKAKPVHRLRTTTRRIEGQLSMLETLPRVPKHSKEAGEARRLLKKLRRAAGNVRDIDVQMDLIGEVAPKNCASEMKDDAAKLREKLDADRGDLAGQLGKVLKKRQSQVTRVLEDLLKALEPLEKFSLSSMELTALTERWYRGNVPQETAGAEDDPDYLHGIRKVAKLARYIAENAPKNAKRPRKLAEEFESLQQSGGEWHDWMVLAEIARDKVGGSSALTKALERRSRMALTAYRRHLRGFPAG